MPNKYVTDLKLVTHAHFVSCTKPQVFATRAHRQAFPHFDVWCPQCMQLDPWNAAFPEWMVKATERFRILMFGTSAEISALIESGRREPVGVQAYDQIMRHERRGRLLPGIAPLPDWWYGVSNAAPVGTATHLPTEEQ